MNKSTGGPPNTNEFGRRAEAAALPFSSIGAPPVFYESAAAGGAGAAPREAPVQRAFNLRTHNGRTRALLNAKRREIRAERLFKLTRSTNTDKANTNAKNSLFRLEKALVTTGTNKLMQQARFMLENVQKRTGIKPAAPRKRHSTRRRNNRK